MTKLDGILKAVRDDGYPDDVIAGWVAERWTHARKRQRRGTRRTRKVDVLNRWGQRFEGKPVEFSEDVRRLNPELGRRARDE